MGGGGVHDQGCEGDMRERRASDGSLEAALGPLETRQWGLMTAPPRKQTKKKTSQTHQKPGREELSWEGLNFHGRGKSNEKRRAQIKKNEIGKKGSDR